MMKKFWMKLWKTSTLFSSRRIFSLALPYSEICPSHLLGESQRVARYNHKVTTLSKFISSYCDIIKYISERLSTLRIPT